MLKDTRESGNSYEYFMGRWSTRVADSFIEWLTPEPGLRWLDVGCGSGALSQAIQNQRLPAELTPISLLKR